ncbi:MAG: sulfatase-like hydrolase/transferase, partial [Candidatus Sulfotelmatobacter sp.]
AIVAGVPTYYSLPAILASRYPLALGREVVGLAPGEKTLASALRQEEYATAFLGAGNPYISAQFGYDFGFDTFRDFVEGDYLPTSNPEEPLTGRNRWMGKVNGVLADASHKIPRIGAAYDELYFRYCQRRAAHSASFDSLRRFPSAEVIVDQARVWLISVRERPFFLWLHFMDPHSPYYPGEKALKNFGTHISASRAQYLNAYWNRSDLSHSRLQSHQNEVLALYDSAIRGVDEQIARLVEILTDLRVWENCIFALTADHGEEFLEHDRRYHAPGLTEELIHIPLIMRAPWAKKKKVCLNPFSLLHLAPTLLAAAELKIPAEFEGRNHWNHIQQGTPWSAPAISECIAGCTNPYRREQRRGARLVAVREERYKLILDFDSGCDHLFDLEADPKEQHPVPSSAGKPHRARLLEVARAHLKRSSAQKDSAASLRARLREVGTDIANLPHHIRSAS